MPFWHGSIDLGDTTVCHFDMAVCVQRKNARLRHAVHDFCMAVRVQCAELQTQARPCVAFMLNFDSLIFRNVIYIFFLISS